MQINITKDYKQKVHSKADNDQDISARNKLEI